MKAVRFKSHGDPADVLTVEDVTVPTPGPGEVRVRMLASPINPADLLFICGKYGTRPTLPATPGFEGVGIVEEGRGLLARFLKGKRVSVLNRQTGNWSEHTTLPAKQAIPISDGIPDEQAACFFVNPASSFAMTRDVLKVPRGEWLLQSAAGSSLGKMVVRLGRRFGFRTINVVRRPEQTSELESLGADKTVVWSDQQDPGDLVNAVREIAPQGVGFAIDPVGGTTGSTIVDCLGHNGRMLTYGTLSGQPLKFDGRKLMTTAARIEGFWLSNHMSGLRLPSKLRLVRSIGRLMKDRVLQSEIAEVFALSDIQAAVAADSQPARNGKTVIRVGD